MHNSPNRKFPKYSLVSHSFTYTELSYGQNLEKVVLQIPVQRGVNLPIWDPINFKKKSVLTRLFPYYSASIKANKSFFKICSTVFSKIYSAVIMWQ